MTHGRKSLLAHKTSNYQNKAYCLLYFSSRTIKQYFQLLRSCHQWCFPEKLLIEVFFATPGKSERWQEQARLDLGAEACGTSRLFLTESILQTPEQSLLVFPMWSAKNEKTQCLLLSGGANPQIADTAKPEWHGGIWKRTRWIPNARR